MDNNTILSRSLFLLAQEMWGTTLLHMSGLSYEEAKNVARDRIREIYGNTWDESLPTKVVEFPHEGGSTIVANNTGYRSKD